MDGKYALSNEKWLTISGNGRLWTGANSEWCGKAHSAAGVAATMTGYLVQSRPEMKPLFPSKSLQKYKIIELMEDYWTAMAPGRRGVLSVFPLRRALALRGKEAGLDLALRELDVPMLRIARPTLDQCVGFIRAGLEADCPVAWLNLHSGRVRGLHGPQWLLITGMTLNGNGPISCTYLEHGRKKEMDFRLWFQSTWTGGGLLYIGRA